MILDVMGGLMSSLSIGKMLESVLPGNFALSESAFFLPQDWSQKPPIRGEHRDGSHVPGTR